MTVNSKGSLFAWLKSKIADMPDSIGYTATLLNEGMKVVYPSVVLDYIDEGAISESRGQFYDLVTLVLKVTDPANNDFKAQMIKKYLDALWGLEESKGIPTNPVAIIPLQDIEGILLGTVAASPCPQIGDMEVRARRNGWREQGNDTLREYARELQIFY